MTGHKGMRYGVILTNCKGEPPLCNCEAPPRTAREVEEADNETAQSHGRLKRPPTQLSNAANPREKKTAPENVPKPVLGKNLKAHADAWKIPKLP